MKATTSNSCRKFPAKLMQYNCFCCWQLLSQNCKILSFTSFPDVLKLSFLCRKMSTCPSCCNLPTGGNGGGILFLIGVGLLFNDGGGLRFSCPGPPVAEKYPCQHSRYLLPQSSAVDSAGQAFFYPNANAFKYETPEFDRLLFVFE